MDFLELSVRVKAGALDAEEQQAAFEAAVVAKQLSILDNANSKTQMVQSVSPVLLSNDGWAGNAELQFRHRPVLTEQQTAPRSKIRSLASSTKRGQRDDDRRIERAGIRPRSLIKRSC
jgi:hypothetical protein